MFQADAALEMERIKFYQDSMKYVLLLQEVQERKKFEFVETVSWFLLVSAMVSVKFLQSYCCESCWICISLSLAKNQILLSACEKVGSNLGLTSSVNKWLVTI